MQRKLRSLRNVDQATATRRLAGMLARKGHGGEVVWRVVREELAASGHAESQGDTEDGWDDVGGGPESP